VHFSGHADATSLVFEKEDGTAWEVPLPAVAELLQRKSAIRCVILNACDSAKALTEPISPFTIGMEDSIDDDAAIEFARGFYDGIATGLPIPEAFADAITAVKFKNLDARPIKLLAAIQAEADHQI